MIAKAFLPAVFTFAVFAANPLFAQGLLERLEKRLEGVIGGETAPVSEEPGYLGLVGDDLEGAPGVLVVSVKADGPAEKAGVREGDIVTAVSDQPVRSLDDLQTQLAGKTAGTKLELTIQRAGKGEKLSAILSTRSAPEEGVAPLPAPVNLPGRASEPPAEGRIPFAPPERPMPEVEPAPETPEAEPRTPVERASLGVSVLPVTDAARRRYGLTVRTGALLSEVVPGGPADRAGLPLGGVVVAAQGRRIERPEDLIEVVQSMLPGDELLLSYYRGASLYRKSVRLGATNGRQLSGVGEPRTAEKPADSAEKIVIREDRPLLKRLEKALEGVREGDAVGPGVGRSTVPPHEKPVEKLDAPSHASAEEVAVLRDEVGRLRAQVSELERRLARLEAPAREKDPAAEDDAPALELKPPALPAAEPPPPEGE